MATPELHSAIERHFLKSASGEGRTLILTNWCVVGVMVDPTTNESGIFAAPYGEPATILGMLTVIADQARAKLARGGDGDLW